MKIPVSLGEYIMYLTEICQLSASIKPVGAEITSIEFEVARAKFSRLAMLIPALKSDLNDSLREHSPEVRSMKKDKLQLFEKACAEVLGKFRAIIARGYAVKSQLDLMIFFCKRFAEITSRDVTSVLNEKVKTSCDSVLLAMSLAYGVDMSPRAFQYGGCLSFEKVSFYSLFKECFSLDEQELLRLLSERQTSNSLFHPASQPENYTVEEVE